MPIVRRSDCVSLPMVFCPVYSCDAGESGGEMLLATSSSQCTHLATRLSSITTTITGQKTIDIETQSDLLTMGVKDPPKHVEE
jgi:hypothetical protein